MCAEKKKITLSCEVDTYRSGWSVVQFLAHRFKYHTAERWTQRVLDDFVRVNGADVSPDHVVKKDDTITYTFLHAEPDVDFKYLVTSITASLVAIDAINYDMSGYTSRAEAQTMLDVLHDIVTKNTKTLKNKETQRFFGAIT